MASANSTSPGTSKRNAGPEKSMPSSAPKAPTPRAPKDTANGQIRILVQEIENRTCDIEILLETVFEKIDGLASAGPAKTLDAVNTLTTCALRNVALIKEHYEHIGALTIGGNQ